MLVCCGDFSKFLFFLFLDPTDPLEDYLVRCMELSIRSGVSVKFGSGKSLRWSSTVLVQGIITEGNIFLSFFLIIFLLFISFLSKNVKSMRNAVVDAAVVVRWMKDGQQMSLFLVSRSRHHWLSAMWDTRSRNTACLAAILSGGVGFSFLFSVPKGENTWNGEREKEGRGREDRRGWGMGSREYIKKKINK